jgi:hypothetical protein
MDQPPAMRVGDRERSEVIDLLRRHAADGRLEPDELEARLEAAFAARTHGELEPLTRDLPPLSAAAPRARAELPASLRAAIAKWAVINAAVIAIWLATGDGLHDFWPKWVLLVSTIVLVLRVARRWTESDEAPSSPPAGPPLPR